MNAIAGIFYSDDKPVERSSLETMLGAMCSRGPHGSALWSDGPVGLGHRTLRTTPESLAECLPLRSSAGDLAITADARIDNRNELLYALGIEPGRAAGLGDGGLILHAYEAWGESCPARLLGDFAFAIWDARRRVFYCARDCFGVKPFYYHRSPRAFIFASEIKALFRLADVPRTINEARIADYLVGELEGIDKTSTFYEEVLRLPPAHAMTVGRERAAIKRFWSLDPHKEVRFDSDEEYEEQFRAVFTEAVRCRLRSASPVGFMLSGGLDSASIVGVARSLGTANGPLSTFSAVSNDAADCCEGPFIEAVVDMGGLEPHFVRPAQLEQFLPDLDLIMRSADDLFVDNIINIVPILYSAACKKGIRVVLDGVDGDVVASQNAEYLSTLLGQGRWVAAWKEAGGLAHFYRSFDCSRRELLWNHGVKPLLPSFARKLWRTLRPRDRLQDRIEDSIIHPDFARRIHLGERLAQLHRDERAPSRRTDREDHYRSIDSAYIPVALERYDRVASAFSVEPRHPFFDRRVVELCLALPRDQKARGGWTKSILRRSMAGVVPEKVRWRTASVNLSSEFFKTLLDLEYERIGDSALKGLEEIGDYVDTRLVRQAHERHASCGSDEDGAKLWQAATLSSWLRRNRHS